MLVNIGVSFLGAITFLFIFWKRLRDDYAAEIVFTSAFYILTGILIGYFLSAKFFKDWFIFAEMAGAGIGLWASGIKFKVRFYEMLEAAILGLMPWVSFSFLEDSVVNSSLPSFIAFVAMLVFIFIYYYLDLHYREFTWYRSGRVGFTGLASLGFVFLVRAAIALFGISVLSFVGKYEAVVSGSLAFASFVLLLNLGRKTK